MVGNVLPAWPGVNSLRGRRVCMLQSVSCFSLEVDASFCTEVVSSYSKLLVGNALLLHYYTSGKVFYCMIRFVQALSSCRSFCWLKRSIPASHKHMQMC